MARITVEDCIDKFPSRFELVLVASNRARKLYAGDNPTVEIDKDKNTVIALREIAEETLTKEKLKNDLIEQYQINTFSEDEELDEDINELEDNTDENQIEMQESDNTETSQSIKNDDYTEENLVEASKDNLDGSLDEDKTEKI
tara:strand:+ start:875 stop:1303 length:429 start_codon:yes stop_codon:yes gene_type:complete